VKAAEIDGHLALETFRLRYADGFQLAIEAQSFEGGEHVAIVGANGSGKTSLLRVLAGLATPTTAASSPPVRSQGRIGYLRQTPYLFRGTVWQNLKYPLRFISLSRPRKIDRVMRMLTLLSLDQHAKRRIETLSGGERKRVAIGRALIAEPHILLLDEPDAHLDRFSRRVVERVINDSSATILLTTHDVQFAHRVGPRVLHLRDGRLTPRPYLNVFAGRLAGDRFITDGGLEMRMAGSSGALPTGTPATGRRAAIEPSSLVLSRERLKSSMLNSFAGRVAAVQAREGNVWLELLVADEHLTAIISRESYERLGLNLQADVVVSFKASAVELF